ncbi:MAG TPA: hypothetical protein VNF06_00340 [Candidatus Aquilonibacter sp.]|nr:hypothetical protein [Candidatus Aquilonibacter sp.]
MSTKPKGNKITIYQSLDFIPGMSQSQTIDAAREVVRRIPSDEPLTVLSVLQTVQDAKEQHKEGSFEYESLNSFQGSFRIAVRDKWPGFKF